jgi:hypothetical protein
MTFGFLLRAKCFPDAANVLREHVGQVGGVGGLFSKSLSFTRCYGTPVVALQQGVATAGAQGRGVPLFKIRSPIHQMASQNCQRDKIWPELVGENKARAA